ncbi:hypothetical protein CXB51_025746 [Gossypium anomalum]|uniref:Uncharacterized protein n=1 Tax=Gossypium anomalum TaxID=47600 RepID=A0A8J5YD70_9ROSI|nr:hypothetical protein CXB51_025746 [Gossypium anomalum]
MALHEYEDVVCTLVAFPTSKTWKKSGWKIVINVSSCDKLNENSSICSPYMSMVGHMDMLQLLLRSRQAHLVGIVGMG